jgi:hypothetical protein
MKSDSYLHIEVWYILSSHNGDWISHRWRQHIRQGEMAFLIGASYSQTNPPQIGPIFYRKKADVTWMHHPPANSHSRMAQHGHQWSHVSRYLRHCLLAHHPGPILKSGNLTADHHSKANVTQSFDKRASFRQVFEVVVEVW